MLYVRTDDDSSLSDMDFTLDVFVYGYQYRNNPLATIADWQGFHDTENIRLFDKGMISG